MGKKLAILTLALTMLGSVAFGQTAELAHRWSFNGDPTDSVGGQNATIIDAGANNATWTDTQIVLAGGGKDASDYVDLPDRILSSLGDSATIEVWATQISIQNWSRIWDFGSSTTHNVFMAWTTATTLTQDRVEWVGPNGTVTVNNSVAPYTLGTEYHIVCVFQPGSVTWYVAPAAAADLGAARGTLQTTNRLSTLDDTNCWLGRSQWGDNTANASFNEVRLWKGALTPEDMEKLHDQGPDTINPNMASAPSPAKGAIDVSRDTLLSWKPAEIAKTHDVYLGTSLADVSAATRSVPLGVLVASGQDANSFDPGRLPFGQTSYWRIDEVAADGTVNQGLVWSFTVEPYSIPITGVLATASSAGKNMGPEKTVDGSGIGDGDLHSNDSADMWVTAQKTALPAWIQYEFDRVHKLDKMLVWNSNQAMEAGLGLGAKDVTVEYSTDGENWTALGDFEFAQAPGDDTCAADTSVNFAGVPVQFVKLTISSNFYGMLPLTGLSEVRFYSVPVVAREPQPTPDAVDLNPQVQFTWRAGREAASHKVYVGTDQQAVTDGTVSPATVSAPEYETSLMLDSTYYWKVAEVNEAEASSTWDSPVWSFSTGSFVAVEDFEAYTDDIDAEETVYQAWIDGYEDDANGSYVGYPDAPFAERSIVHSGAQSMPMSYENTGGVTRSEAKRTFATAQDWTLHGVKTLVLFFRGQPSNSPASVYLKINDTKLSFSNGAPATTLPLWKQWNIDLATAGVTLKSVKSLTIGVEGSGTGMLFVDDIRLYAVAPAIIGAADPGTTGLVALYKMDGNVQDSSGKNYHGVLTGESGYDTGYAGQALNFNGTNTYVDLPIGPLVPTLTSVTIASHVNFNGTTNWQRVFDFGNNNTTYMFLSPRRDGSNVVRFAITKTSSAGEQAVQSPTRISLGWHHLAVTIDSATMMLKLYVDGEMVDDNATTLLPKDLGTTTQNWLGRSQWPDDGYFLGMLDEFRIYNRVLSAEEVRYLAGDR